MNRYCDMLNPGLVLGLTFATALVIGQAAHAEQAEPSVKSPNSAMIGSSAGDADRDSNVIEVYINRLRRKLGNDLIETRRGQGYSFKGTS